ncbi:hypothetical protein [Chengkuizengella sediminis]|uniref:hypothetical protein n=1 Tax=Chengkuizengella sediminis TaxID=1885917 RepID=UPI0013899A29|nr:hypothetical protein [Chengkuizengella sediminis]NDI36662.1 hypothetical protein [Chengkuizengella sediminis]
MAGFYYEINGYVHDKYSNEIILKLLSHFNINKGVAEIYEVEETQVNYDKIEEYVDEWFEAPFENLSVCNLKSHYFKEIKFNYHIFDKEVPFRLLITMHENLTFSITMMFDYTEHVEYERDIVKLKRKNEEIEKLYTKFYSSGLYLYGTYGVEIFPVSLISIKFEEESICMYGDGNYFSHQIINKDRILELQKIGSIKFNILENGYLVLKDDMDNRYEIYEEWVGKIVNDLRNSV